MTGFPKAVRDLQKSRANNGYGEKYGLKRDGHFEVGGDVLELFDVETSAGDLITRWSDRKIDLVYSDPPWGAANASTFRRKAEMEVLRSDYDRFRKSFTELVVALGAPAVIEMGLKWVGDWVQGFEDAGLSVVTVEGVYYRTKPMVYMVMDRGTGLLRGIERELAGLDDDYSAGVACKRLPKGSVVADPCCGMGNTAAHAKEQGHRFMGNELALYRAGVTAAVLDWYAKGGSEV